MLSRLVLTIACLLAACYTGYSQQSDEPQGGMNKKFESLDYRLDRLEKMVDDVLWHQRVGDVALMDKVYIVGPPVAHVRNPKEMGAANPLKFWAYVFLPRDLDPSAKYPLLVLPHGGVHGDFGTYHTHIIRELIAQGYIVVAPEYRGSSGYGQDFSDRIDYGGREVDDNRASRDYMVEQYGFVDPNRVGILGWSHGGLITLMDIFQHPDSYQVAFAGVPVSDLVARMGYSDDAYRKLFSSPSHIGKTPREDIEEYRKRSPVTYADKLKTPLLIHTNTNDDDVYVLEVEHMIDALKAAGKDFDYQIFKDAPGGHSFDRIDTKLAKETRLKIYAFLARYLKPRHQLKSLEDIQRAAYLPAPGVASPRSNEENAPRSKSQ